MLRWMTCLGALALGVTLAGQSVADATKSDADVPRPNKPTGDLIQQVSLNIDQGLDRRLSNVFGVAHRASAAISGKRPEPVTAAPVTADREPSRIVYTWNWIDALPADTGGRQWQCLAEALYHEARGESVKGQFAVAEVILNRVESRLWPSTVCNVVHQGTGQHLRCQFTWTCDGYSDRIRERRAFERAGKIARLMMAGGARVLTGGATHYHTRAVNPRWSRQFPRTAEIGTHYFYRHPRS